MIENIELVRQAITSLDAVLTALDTDPALTGATVHIQWAIDILSDAVVPAAIAPSTSTRPTVSQD